MGLKEYAIYTTIALAVLSNCSGGASAKKDEPGDSTPPRPTPALVTPMPTETPIQQAEREIKANNNKINKAITGKFAHVTPPTDIQLFNYGVNKEKQNGDVFHTELKIYVSPESHNLEAAYFTPNEVKFASISNDLPTDPNERTKSYNIFLDQKEQNGQITRIPYLNFQFDKARTAEEIRELGEIGGENFFAAVSKIVVTSPVNGEQITIDDTPSNNRVTFGGKLAALAIAQPAATPIPEPTTIPQVEVTKDSEGFVHLANDWLKIRVNGSEATALGLTGNFTLNPDYIKDGKDASTVLTRAIKEAFASMVGYGKGDAAVSKLEKDIAAGKIFKIVTREVNADGTITLDSTPKEMEVDLSKGLNAEIKIGESYQVYPIRASQSGLVFGVNPQTKQFTAILMDSPAEFKSAAAAMTTDQQYLDKYNAFGIQVELYPILGNISSGNITKSTTQNVDTLLFNKELKLLNSDSTSFIPLLIAK